LFAETYNNAKTLLIYCPVKKKWLAMNNNLHQQLTNQYQPWNHIYSKFHHCHRSMHFQYVHSRTRKRVNRVGSSHPWYWVSYLHNELGLSFRLAVACCRFNFAMCESLALLALAARRIYHHLRMSFCFPKKYYLCLHSPNHAVLMFHQWVIGCQNWNLFLAYFWNLNF
jgi:hypothetical protein